MTVYRPAFARYFDDFATDWVKGIAPQLSEWLEASLPAERRKLLDLCCGGGITAAHFAARGWEVTGFDKSAGMLEVAADRLRSEQLDSRVELVEGRAEELPTDLAVDATICLDGALNHLDSTGTLQAVLTRIAATTAPGGLVMFDLYEQDHLAHWNHVTVTDRPGTVMSKRGVWDRAQGHGMLRISGHHTVDGAGVVAVDQVLESWHFSADDVAAALVGAGLRPVPFDAPWTARKCHSGSCSQQPAPCRSLYAAIVPPADAPAAEAPLG